MYINNYNEKIKIEYKIPNLNQQQQRVLVNNKYLEDCYRCQQRTGLDFQITFQFDLKLIFTNFYTGDSFEYPNTFLFNLCIPIMTGTYPDPITKMSVKEIWDKGLDLNHSGGDIILSGVKYLLPNIFSYPFNKPVVDKADKYNQVVRCEFIRQLDPFFGNTYHVCYAIVENKVDKDIISDIIINVKESYDTRFLSQDSQHLIYIPLNLIFYAYGAENDEQIINLCNRDNSQQLRLFMINCFRIGQYSSQFPRRYTALQAKQEIAKLLIKPEYYNDIDKILEKYINPFNQTFLTQLGEIVNKMFKVYINQTPEEDKQDLRNKRIETVSNQVIGELRSKLYTNFQKQMKNLAEAITIYNYDTLKQYGPQLIDNNIASTIRSLYGDFEKSMKRSFISVNSTNQQSDLKKVQNDQKSKELEILQKREIVIRQEIQNVKVDYNKRKVQMSFYGFIDPIQTPEAGADVGRYLSPNIYTYVTKCQTTDSIINFLEHNPLILRQVEPFCASVKVNYNILYYVKYENFFKLYYELMDWRLQNSFYKQLTTFNKLTDSFDQLMTSVFFDIENQAICINTDTGRLMTPIITPKLQKLDELYQKSYYQLLYEGKIIFICPDMITNFIVKEWQDIFSREKDSNIHYFLPFGLTAGFNSINPFSGYMKSIRSCLFTSQGKQSIQQPVTNHMSDCSGTQLISHQLQASPIDTPVSRSLYRQFPIGNIVYIMLSQYVYNQEDAFISNNGYIYRNGLSSSEYKVYSNTSTNNEQYFGVLPEAANKYENRWVNNPASMVCQMGANIKYNDTIISKIIWIEDKKKRRIAIDKEKLVYTNNSDQKYSTLSNVMFKSLEDGVDMKLVRIQLARYPIIGDKIVSKNCQKGIIGQLLEEYQLPITAAGIVPSFIISSPSILKRETYGQIIEPLYNKYLIMNKIFTDDVGIDKRIKDINQKLCNIENETVYTAQGKEMGNKILCGPMLFSSQCHLVSRKIRACDDTSIDQLTRQPGAGKKNGGAMKYGVLEQTSLEAQGISNTLVSQAGFNSSNIHWYYCKKCNYDQVYYNAVLRHYICPRCGQLNEHEVGSGSFNYGEQLMSNILYSMGMGVQVK